MISFAKSLQTTSKWKYSIWPCAAASHRTAYENCSAPWNGNYQRLAPNHQTQSMNTIFVCIPVYKPWIFHGRHLTRTPFRNFQITSTRICYASIFLVAEKPSRMKVFSLHYSVFLFLFSLTFLGFEKLLDLVKIVHRCPNLRELDLSDCTMLTLKTIDIVSELPQLEYLSLSRCYNINVAAYL